MARKVEGYMSEDGSFFATEREAQVQDARQVVQEFNNLQVYMLIDEPVAAGKLIVAFALLHQIPGVSGWQIETWVADREREARERDIAIEPPTVLPPPASSSLDDIPF